MSDIYLTHSEAVEACELYWSGEKIRAIHSKFDVDPRRLYEILDGETHHSAREEFLERLKVSRPNLAKKLANAPRWRRGTGYEPHHPQLPF